VAGEKRKRFKADIRGNLQIGVALKSKISPKQSGILGVKGQNKHNGDEWVAAKQKTAWWSFTAIRESGVGG